MNPYYDSGGITIYNGDCREVLPTLPSNSVDSIVTDPPYELGFMNKAWDRTGIAFNVEMWKECLRVLKPGGYLLSFGGTRTYHRMVCAIEDAGFIIHPLLAWIQSQGFPKATNLSKRFDTEAGVKRVVIGRDESFLRRNPNNTGIGTLVTRSDGTSLDGRKTPYQKSDAAGLITSPSTPEAKQWDGWFYGLQTLKPSIEPICMAQKPISEKRMTDNIRKWGTGALNIGACRIGNDQLTYRSRGAKHLVDQHFQNDRPYVNGLPNRGEPEKTVQGRWPANVLFDEPAAALLDLQSGYSKSTKRPPTGKALFTTSESDRAVKWNPNNVIDNTERGHDDSGGASRFFYVAKASRSERWFYCNDCQDAFPPSEKEDHWHSHVNEKGEKTWVHLESHPTQKPLRLIRYLVRLVTPPNGKVLDPFAGSGTTGLACQTEGFSYILIERDPHFIDIIHRRLDISPR